MVMPVGRLVLIALVAGVAVVGALVAERDRSKAREDACSTLSHHSERADERFFAATLDDLARSPDAIVLGRIATFDSITPVTPPAGTDRERTT